MIKLRDYQEQALAAEAEHRAEHPDETRLAIVMATGLGKTIVMAERARRFLAHMPPLGGQRVLILVHTDELAQQAEAKVRLVVRDSWVVGVVKAERDEVNADIVIGSVQTLANPERRRRLTDVGLVIVDECHHATASTYQEIMRHYGCFDHLGLRTYGPTPALGLTATLERGDGTSLGGVWQNVVFTRDISWAVRRGHLVQPIGHRIEIDGLDLRGEHQPPGFLPYSAKVVDTALADSIAPERVVDEWFKHAGEKGEHLSTVLFAPLVRSAEAFARAFADAGISVGVVSGATNPTERRLTLKMYEAGEIEVICNAMVLTEGWDSPRTECVIVARPTKSRPLFVQMAGRGLRPDPLKPIEDQSCLLLVVADATTDMCTIADLSDRVTDRKATGALTAMEDAWDIGKALEEDARHWAGKVTTTEFDPLVRRSSKVWRTTKGGTPFLPIGKGGQYVFIVGTSVFLRNYAQTVRPDSFRTVRLHKDLPDLELALQVAEDEATDRGGDVGALLADRSRPWRKQVPKHGDPMVEYAMRLGLKAEVHRILDDRAGGKAGKISDLIARVEATRAIDPLVARIKEKVGA